MTFEQVLSDLKQKKYKPVYFLTGEESYFIDQITDIIEETVLEESERAFNQTILYGKDSHVPQVLENAKRFPMMSERQVVIVKEAQHIKDIESIAEYVKNPMISTVLVIAYKGKNIDGRKKEGKELSAALAKNGILFESKTLYDNQLPDWITQTVKLKGFAIKEKAATMLSEYLGNDLSKISNELTKLTINILKGSTIDELLIEKNIGISKEYNNFEFQKIIASRNIQKSLTLASYFSKNQKEVPLLLTTSTLFNFFSKVLAIHLSANKSKDALASSLKIRPFFMGDYMIAAKNYDIKKTVEIIALLREYDAKSKGVDESSSPGDLVLELTYKILF